MPDLIPTLRATLLWRYLRLYAQFARQSLLREMSCRLHFAARCLTHAVWIGLYLAAFEVLLLYVERVGDWDRYPYLLFQGTYLLLNTLVNGLFLNNAADLADRVRSGDLDTALVLPADEQFLLTCRRVDWAVLPQAFVGGALVARAAAHLDEPWTALDGLSYALLLGAGVAILYSGVVLLASVAFWAASREALFDLWFAVMEVVRIPPDVFRDKSLLPARCGLFGALPVVVAVNVPARFGARLLGDPWQIVGLCLTAAACLVASRGVFRRGLRSYRSVGG